MIKITFRGIQSEVATPREAAELMMFLDQMQGAQLKRASALVQPATAAQAVAAAEAPVLPANGFDANAAMIEVLRVLVDAGQRGVGVDGLMAPLKTDKRKGVGGRLAVVNKELLRVGVQVADAYTSGPTKNEGRKWYATEKTPEAIELLEQARGGA
jgi:hypothetical protein